MDQTPGGTPPPTTDTPATPPATDPGTPVTTPPTETPAPAGSPPVSDTPTSPPATPPTDSTPPAEPPTLDSETPKPAETPMGEPTPETPATPPADPATHTDPPAAESPVTAASIGDSGSTHTEETAKSDASASKPPSHDDNHKSFSKPMMVVAGLLVVGALSAVLLVANMQTGDTQSSANSPRKQPTLPTQAATPAQQAVMTDPNLVINTPKEGSVVTTPTVTVSGKTFPNAEVVVNETELTANPGGVFTTTVALEEGENTLIIVANDAEGNTAETELNVTYETE